MRPEMIGKMANLIWGAVAGYHSDESLCSLATLNFDLTSTHNGRKTRLAEVYVDGELPKNRYNDMKVSLLEQERHFRVDGASSGYDESQSDMIKAGYVQEVKGE